MSVLSDDTINSVKQALVKAGLITDADAKQMLIEAEKEHTPFLTKLISSGKVTDEQLTKTIADINQVPYVNLSNAKIDPNVLGLLPQDTAERYMAVPLGEMQHRLVVAMLDADNVQAVDFLSNKIGRPLKVYAASESGIRRVLKQYRAKLDKEVTDVFEEEAKEQEDKDVKDPSQQNIKSIVQDSPISKALSAILEYAANNRASDIHIEPLEADIKIRARVDGVLREIMRLPKSIEAPLVSRVKILSNLKIDEHRIPQDGQFTIKVAGRNIDLRIAISPTVWGEQVVIRLLDKEGTVLKLEDMGYRGRTLNRVKEALKNSNGMILTSGPTGSGKTTSMYAMIEEIKSDDINIVTLEDPVEYKIQGVNQIQVNPEVGLTFASGLRSILRQDPDVVMVGEIRDKETAQLAVQAALTGHLVFSTLHTNSAAGILPRLLDMEIEPFLIASTVRTVLGQRLIRKIGDDKEEYKADAAEIQAVQATIGNLLPPTKEDVDKFCKELGYKTLPLRAQNAYTLYKGKDSPDAPGGYKGRMGIYEAFDITDKIEDLILKRAASSDIQKMAIAEGMISMRQDGYLKALAGMSTIKEINRVASSGNM